MADLPLNLAAAMGGKLKKTVVTKSVGGGTQTVTFDVAAALPQKYRSLTVEQFHCGFSNCYTHSTVSVTVAEPQYNSSTGALSVMLSISSGYTFSGKLSLAIIYA